MRRLAILALLLLAATARCAAADVHAQLTSIGRQCAAYGINGTPQAAPIDSLLRLQPRKVSRAALLKAVFSVMASLNRNQQFGQCVRLGSAVVPQLSDGNSSKEELQYYIYMLDELGAACSSTGLLSELCDTYNRAMGIAKAHGMEAEEAILLNNLGTMYSGQGDHRKAESCLRLAIKINEAAGNRERLMVNYNNLSGDMVARGLLDKGLELAFLALHQLDGMHRPDLEMLMRRNIASIYRKQGQPQMALEMAMKIADNQQRHGQQMYLSDTYRLMGEIYADMGQTGKARGYYEKALAVNGGATTVEQRAVLLGSLADACASQHDYQAAYAAMKQRAALRDSVAAAENTGRTHVIENLYASEQTLLHSIDTLRTWRAALLWALTLVLVLAAAAIYFIIRATRIRVHQKFAQMQKAANSDRQTMRQMREQHAAEVARLNQRIAKLDDEARHNASAEMTRSIAAMHNSEYIGELNNQLKATMLKLNPKNTEARATVRSVLALIANYESGYTAEEFRKIFDKVYPSFFDNLFDRVGELTPKEMRLCAFIRLGLSTKSIADITFREVRSVESARNRLRKKFGLQQQDSLVTFLHQF